MLFFLAIVIILITTTVYSITKKNISLVCKATTFIYDENPEKSLKVDAILHMDGDDDYFEIGLFYNDKYTGDKLIEIHRIINFSYRRTGNSFTLFSEPSTDTMLTANIRNVLNNYLPDFFLISYRGIKLQIIDVNSDSHVVLVDRFPVFYCTNNK
jgi:hypothetical protein